MTVQANAQAMKDAAKNPNGAMVGMAGVNMVNMTGNATAAALRDVNANAAPAAESWTCPKCGAVCTGNFCPVCGEAKPAASFCPHCGKEVPAGATFCPHCGKQL